MTVGTPELLRKIDLFTAISEEYRDEIKLAIQYFNADPPDLVAAIAHLRVMFEEYLIEYLIKAFVGKTQNTQVRSRLEQLTKMGHITPAQRDAFLNVWSQLSEMIHRGNAKPEELTLVFHALTPLLDWFNREKTRREQRVMMLYDVRDRADVDKAGLALKAAGFEPVGEDHFCIAVDDDWPGDELAAEIRSCANVVAIVGTRGTGPWCHGEMIRLLYNQLSADRTFRAFAAILPGADVGVLPRFLQERTVLSLDDGHHRAMAIRILDERRAERQQHQQQRAGHSPYPGLRSFSVEDAHVFFGRNERIERLLDAIAPDENPRREKRFLAILGASGSGKSSLAQAGLLAALQRGALPNSERWLQVTCRPGRRPLENLTQQLYANASIAKCIPDFGGFVKGLKSDRETLHWTTAATLAGADRSDRIVVLVDQFEELFNECEDREEQKAFIDNLVHAGTELDGQTIVVVTLRVDYFDRSVDFPELWDALSSNQEAAPPMEDRDLREAIDEPARQCGRQVERGLTELLIRDMHHHRAALPLLQHVLHQLWDEDAGLTVEGYENLGGLRGALEKHADAVYEKFDEQQQSLGQQVLLELSRPGADSSQDTRRQLRLDELCRLLGNEEMVKSVTNELASEKARLLICDRAEEPGGEESATVEIAHEALIRNWPRLRNWLNEVRDWRRFEQVLEEAAMRWEQSHRDETNLSYQGKRLRDAVLWAERNPQRVEKLVDVFLGRCVVKEVEQLLKYDLQRLSLALEEFGVLRNRARDFLKSVCDTSEETSRERLVAGIALLPLDDSQLAYLTERLLSGTIFEFELLCEQLKQSCGVVSQTMLLVLSDEDAAPEKRFRAALAIARGNEAKVASEHLQQHARLVASLAIDMINVDPASYAIVLETLMPFAGLLRPYWLDGFFHGTDPTRWLSVSRFLTDTMHDDTDVLTEMLLEAKPGQFSAVFDRVRESPQVAVAGARRELSRHLASLATEEEKEKLARRQANAAVALIRLEKDSDAFELLRHSEDPRARSYLIHQLSELGVPPQALLVRFAGESDVSVQRAILLALGEYPRETLDGSMFESFAPELKRLHQSHEDAGIHGAAEWLLRQWGMEAEIETLRDGPGWRCDAGSQWSLELEQHTFVTVHAGEFLMGSQESDPHLQSNEMQHRRTINRRYCISACATTRAQYKRFFEESGVTDIINEDYIRAIVPDERSPMTYVTWYEAAWYCNWLSAKAGIPEAQWCYLPNSDGKYHLGMRPRDGYLSLCGFRLPTEAEWEFACRAGATTRRYYGHCDELLPKYASFHDNTQGHTAHAGIRKPNDFGLFDMHGGVWTWCNDQMTEYIDPSDDSEDYTPLGAEIRMLRGGAFGNMSPHIRTACRNKLNHGDHRFHQLGFRVARTCPCDAQLRSC